MCGRYANEAATHPHQSLFLLERVAYLMTSSVSLSKRWIFLHVEGDRVLAPAVPRLGLRVETTDKLGLALGEVDDDLRAHGLGDVDRGDEAVVLRCPGWILPSPDVFRTDAEDHFFVDVGADVFDLVRPLAVDLELKGLPPSTSVVVALFLEHDVDEVHRRRADKAGDEQVDGLVVDLQRRADLLDEPSFITQMRSPIVIASIWSWVT